MIMNQSITYEKLVEFKAPYVYEVSTTSNLN